MINIYIKGAEYITININCKAYFTNLKDIFNLFYSKLIIDNLYNFIDENLNLIDANMKHINIIGKTTTQLPIINMRDNGLFYDNGQIGYIKTSDGFIADLNKFNIFLRNKNFYFGYKKMYFQNPNITLDLDTYENFVYVLKKLFIGKASYFSVKLRGKNIFYKNYYVFTNPQKIRKYNKCKQKKSLCGKTNPYIFSLILSGYYVDEKRFNEGNLWNKYRFDKSSKLNDIVFKYRNVI